MPLKRSERVAARFGARAADYERHAILQATIAKNLAEMLTDMASPSILEVGCGTGLLTGKLLERYPDADILATDIAPEMVEKCQENFKAVGSRLQFSVMNGETPATSQTFDLIVTSMTVQWFSDPVVGLRALAGQLRPGGELWFSTLAADCLPEWRKILETCNVDAGLIEMPELPGVCYETSHVIEYGSGLAFLESLKAIGATMPRPGYRPLPPGRLRKLLRTLDDDSGARMTWRIVYGCIRSDEMTVT